MFNSISKILEKPSLYEKSQVAFWDDEHISKQMLKAHLDPDFEGASRKAKDIEDSANWIKEVVPPSKYPRLLDIGCGPGLYAEKFTKMGYQVTGVDFSKRSIDYAQSSAKEQGLNIIYHYKNYLEMELQERYDFATMIYCDYGALSTEDRKILLQKIFTHLKPNGKLLMDVFSISQYSRFQEKQTWEKCCNGGFWSNKPYIALNGCYKYQDDVTLEQISVLSKNSIASYYLWTTYFSKESLIEEAVDSGFKVCEVLGDVKGSPYHEENLTIAILLEK